MVCPDAYVAGGVLGKTSRSDAIHVATATVAEADLIVSWNFKHIVNYNRIHKTRETSADFTDVRRFGERNGFRCPRISFSAKICAICG
jgi:hypothetical protein